MTKTTHVKGKKHGKKTQKRNYTNVKSIQNNLNLYDSSIKLLNSGKQKKYRCKKSVALDSLSYSNTAAAGLFITFDPSGTVGTFAGIPEWASFAQLFDEYKVNWITVTFELRDSVALTETNNYLYYRYCYDDSTTTPTLAQLSELPNIYQKNFTSTNPNVQYRLKPKVRIVSDAATGGQVQSMKFSDVDKPFIIWGLSFYHSALSATQTLVMNIEYDMTFKYSN